MRRLCCALLLTFCLPAWADIALVRDGQPQATIIVPDDLGKPVQLPAERLTSDGHAVVLAAVEVADYPEKITGVRPLIRTESARHAKLRCRAGAASRAA